MLVILPTILQLGNTARGESTLSIYVLTESQVPSRLKTLPRSPQGPLLLPPLLLAPPRLPQPPYLLLPAPEPGRPPSTPGPAEAAPPGAAPSESCPPTPPATPESLSSSLWTWPSGS